MRALSAPELLSSEAPRASGNARSAASSSRLAATSSGDEKMTRMRLLGYAVGIEGTKPEEPIFRFKSGELVAALTGLKIGLAQSQSTAIPRDYLVWKNENGERSYSPIPSLVSPSPV